ncbi:MAG: insulinase family protein, partial [Ruminococcus sp.]|nr:insulinase family protein [Ruminococcus sp.]
FRTDCAVPDKEVNATRLMCAILGGTANSKLFCNVREKQSLCYYCASRYNMQKGILSIDSGVEGENLEKAEKAILKEVADMKRGEITDFEIEATKMAVINSFNSSNDTVSGIESWYSNQLLNDEFKSIEELSAEINAITKEEIIKAAQKLTLDTVYVLKNK